MRTVGPSGRHDSRLVERSIVVGVERTSVIARSKA
jgi:hypothetical protein